MPLLNLNDQKQAKSNGGTSLTRSLVENRSEYIPAGDDAKRESIADLKAENLNGDEKPKRAYRKTGKYKGLSGGGGASTPEPKADPVDFSGLSDVFLDLVVPRLPNPLPVSPAERKTFGEAVNKVAQKYLPSFGDYDAEMSLALAAVIVFAPRLKKADETPAAEKQE